MPMRLSTLFVRTLREDPVGADVDSHKLLVRAGYIRRTAPGIYTWLPLGLKVLDKLETIVREEMAAAGAQEVHFPALLPREPYEASGRWTDYGDNMFRLKDRKGADYALAPTHEEVFTLLVKDLFASYKDLPTTIYQIQTKYRDEGRPRAGLLRGREFIMKDAYSFDIDDAGLDESYRKQREAYVRAFDRIGLDYVIVKATSGAMGGSRSEEFLHPSDIGEDSFVRSSGGYAANIEAVTTSAPDPIDHAGVPAAHVEDTPDTPTIDTLVAAANHDQPRPDRPWTAADTLKNVVVAVTHPDGEREVLVIGVPGDRDVDLERAEGSGQLGAGEVDVEPATEADLAARPGLVRGYIGPAGFDEDGVHQVLGTEGVSGVRYLLDPRIVDGTRWITGANEHGKHVFDLVAGRDFSADGTVEAAEVREGDPAPDGSGPLQISRGIEIGHIFQLGRIYADAVDLKVLDENGKQVVPTMGSYGLGITRVLAAVAEGNHDDKGLIWPKNLAPADVHVIATGKDPQVYEAGEKLVSALDADAVEVLFDDRGKVSPGVKFADAELLGVPTIVVVGRGLARGVVEVRDRRTAEAVEVLVGEAAEYITRRTRQ